MSEGMESGHFSVIASGAKQSSFQMGGWIASSLTLLAMTGNADALAHR
jgi:hypothetical protein